MKWTLHEGLRNVGGVFDLVRRTYTPLGKLYPRLILAVYHSHWGSKVQGLKLACSTKSNSSGMWLKADIPLDLVEDACGLLKEAKAKVTKENS